MINQSSILQLSIRALCALALAPVSAPALDLTPRSGVRVGNEGAPTPVVQFADGDGKIDFQPPLGWQASGGGRAVSFFNPIDTRAWMKLMVVEKQAPPPSGGPAASPEDLQAWATQFLPAGTTRQEFVKSVPSPFTIGSHQSTEFVFNVAAFGWRDSVSISVVDLSPTERLLVVVSADAHNFERVRQQAIASMFSWSAEE